MLCHEKPIGVNDAIPRNILIASFHAFLQNLVTECTLWT
jgi:hypothetical protein